MPGHSHNSSAETQNQGNSLGDRSCVRQSKLYRMYESGNGVKDILGTNNLRWDVDKKSGAYAGHKVYDHMTDNGPAPSQQYGYSANTNTDFKNYGNAPGNSYDNVNAPSNVRMPFARDNTYVEPNSSYAQYQSQQTHQPAYSDYSNRGPGSSNGPTSLKEAYMQRLSAREGRGTNSARQDEMGGVAAVLGGGGYGTTADDYPTNKSYGAPSGGYTGAGGYRTGSGGYAREPQRRPSFENNAANIINSSAASYGYGGGAASYAYGGGGAAATGGANGGAASGGDASYAYGGGGAAAIGAASGGAASGGGYGDRPASNSSSTKYATGGGSGYSNSTGGVAAAMAGNGNDYRYDAGGGYGNAGAVSGGGYGTGRRVSMEEPGYGYRGGDGGIAAAVGHQPAHTGRYAAQQQQYQQSSAAGEEPRSTRPW